jgi:large subunit ribosomal protein L24
MKFSKHWKSSTQVRKQRKYRYNAPLHLRASFLHAHLSKPLREKYNTRAVRIKKGDKVKIMKGKFAKIEGKVEMVNAKKSKIYVEKAEIQKKDGSKVFYPLDPSNIVILELNTEDKNRFRRMKENKK